MPTFGQELPELSLLYSGAWSDPLILLTRLQVKGFKNLVDVDVRFGPFTCIAGANGIGKSNLFDAIFFLSALAEIPFLDAAMSVRDERLMVVTRERRTKTES